MSNELNTNNINDADIEYEIVIKKSNDILNELTTDIHERLIYESIIDGIEKGASEAIKAGKIAGLPFIGALRKSPVRQVVKDNFENFKIARKNMSADQYKEHVREIIIDAKINQEKIDKEKAYMRLVMSCNRKRYDKLYLSLGRAYADMFIKSIVWLQEVPYNEEVQQHYDNLNAI